VFRLSKLADYGILLLAELARDTGTEPHTARELSETSELPAPVVSKILKTLARQGVIESQRGAKGGYTFLRRPEELTVAAIIEALDGPVALTECSIAPDICIHETNCQVRGPLLVLNQVVQSTLSQVTLADLIDPSFTTTANFLGLLQFPRTPERTLPTNG
jgi:FeS assembly SUF system regulator